MKIQDDGSSAVAKIAILFQQTSQGIQNFSSLSQQAYLARSTLTNPELPRKCRNV